MLSMIKTQPTSLPVELEEVKKYLRVDESEDDSEILSMINVATRRVEAHIDKKIITQAWSVFYDRFPTRMKNDWWDGVKEMAISELTGAQRHIVLPFGNLKSIESFYTYDNQDNEIEFDAANYAIDVSPHYGRVALRQGSVWPTTVLRPINGIKITGIYGYDTKLDVPEEIKMAIKMYVSNMYEHRGDQSEIKVPNMALHLLEPHRYQGLHCG